MERTRAQIKQELLEKYTIREVLELYLDMLEDMEGMM